MTNRNKNLNKKKRANRTQPRFQTFNGSKIVPEHNKVVHGFLLNFFWIHIFTIYIDQN